MYRQTFRTCKNYDSLREKLEYFLVNEQNLVNEVVVIIKQNKAIVPVFDLTMRSFILPKITKKAISKLDFLSEMQIGEFRYFYNETQELKPKIPFEGIMRISHDSWIGGNEIFHLFSTEFDYKELFSKLTKICLEEIH